MLSGLFVSFDPLVKSSEFSISGALVTIVSTLLPVPSILSFVIGCAINFAVGGNLKLCTGNLVSFCK